MPRESRVISSGRSRHPSSFRRILIGREITSVRDSRIPECGRVSLEMIRRRATSVKIECEPVECNSRRINLDNYHPCKGDRSFDVAASGDVFISSSPHAHTRATRTISRRYGLRNGRENHVDHQGERDTCCAGRFALEGRNGTNDGWH